MIVWLMVILSGLLIVTLTQLKNRWWRWTSSAIMVIALLASAAMIVANTTYHWGLKTKTTTTSHRIYSAGSSQSPAGMLITKELGTDSGRYVLMYKDTATAKKAQAHFVPNTANTVKAVKQRATYRQVAGKQATVTTTTKRWVWQSSTAKFWLKIGTTPNLLISRRSVVTVPKQTWLVVTATQAQQLAKLQKSMTATQQAAQATTLKAALKTKLGHYIQKHPQATKAQQQAYLQQQTAILTVQQLQKQLN